MKQPWARYARFGAAGKAGAAIARLLDLVWPPLSPLSGRAVSEPGLLDPDDWARIQFLAPPWCKSCGVPFPYPSGAGMVCPACAARAPVYSRARAAFVYDPSSRALALGLKHAGRTDGLSAFGRWMARAGAECLDGADALIPVPLHRRRLRQRRFNQSLLLARAVSRVSGVGVEAHALQRVRATPSQGGMSARGRVRNMAGAFKVRPARLDAVRGRRLVLIDDVHTTGATLEACARALKRAGAADVRAITLARVVKPVNLIK
ncbi:MAG: ComF family protein [Oceanicaulis sp.]|nr:ComF family protein [Oceanicaulis sp.]